MATTQIRGNTQIKALTITNAEISATAGIELTKLAEAVIQADGGQAFTANQSHGGFKITSLGDGTVASDGVNLGQLNNAVAALSVGGAHPSVRLATTGNITLSGTQTIDGVAGSSGDRILVKSQTAPAENGIYVMAAGAWARATDADTWNELTQTPLVAIQEGTTLGDTLWLITANAGGTLNTTAVTLVQLPGPSDVIAGAGLTRTGQTIDVVATDTSITVAANDLGVNVNASGGLEISTGVRVKLNGTTLDRSASGMKVADAGITETQLNTSVAGNGLAGGAGTALSVNTDGNAIFLSGDAVTLRLDGSSLSVSASGLKVNTAKFIVREVPGGAVNGSNTVYTLANTPVAGKEMVFLNGLLQEPGGEDYSISAATITFVTAPATGDRIRVTYLIA